MHRYHPRHVKRRRSFHRLFAALTMTVIIGLSIMVAAPQANADYYGTRFADGNKPICVSTGWIDNSRVRAAVKAAVSDWSTSTSLDLRTRTSCGAYKQRIWVLDASYGQNGWLGKAYVTRSWWGESPTPYRWTHQGYTYLHDRVTLKMNLTTLRGLSSSQIQSTAAHEIGHALGLNHTSVSNSVMREHGWTKSVQYWDRLGTWDHPGVNRLYAEG